MHGHQLRLLAEEEHVALWTDISVGSLYGAIKRLAAEELIEEVRVERSGAYPQRQVWAITDDGREALSVLRLRALRDIVIKPDPFDIAVTRVEDTHLEDLAGDHHRSDHLVEAMLERVGGPRRGDRPLP